MTTLRDRLQELLDEADDSDAETLGSSSDRSEDEISEATDDSFINDDDDITYVPDSDSEDECAILCGITVDGHGVVINRDGLYEIK